jgi:hypothetical protein
MKTRYRFIHFIETAPFDGKPLWYCRNIKSEDELGKVFWYAPWKRYCFTQSKENIVFSADCLTDIAHFMGQLPKP